MILLDYHLDTWNDLVELVFVISAILFFVFGIFAFIKFLRK